MFLKGQLYVFEKIIIGIIIIIFVKKSFLVNAQPRTHIGPSEFSHVNMLPVELRVLQLKLNHVFTVVNNKAPSYLRSSIKLNYNLHNRNTTSGICP